MLTLRNAKNNNLLLFSLMFFFEALQYVKAQSTTTQQPPAEDDDAELEPSKAVMRGIDIGIACYLALNVIVLVSYCALRSCWEKGKYQNNRCMQWFFKHPGDQNTAAAASTVTPSTPLLNPAEDRASYGATDNASEGKRSITSAVSALNPLFSPVENNKQHAQPEFLAPLPPEDLREVIIDTELGPNGPKRKATRSLPELRYIGGRGMSMSSSKA